MKQNKPDKSREKSQGKSQDTRLVYSSEGGRLKLCKTCFDSPCECSEIGANIATIVPEKLILKIKLEKNQRGGKLVTVIHDFPYNPAFFEDLTKKLKNHCGTGGTYKKNDQSPQIELQGDCRAKIEAFLLKLNIKSKRSGG